MTKPVATWLKKSNINRRHIASLLVFLIAIYVLLPQLSFFNHSLAGLAHANTDQIMLCLGYTVGIYILTALLYQVLAKSPLRYGQTLLVQTSTGFASRLLPIGIGTASVSTLYLRRSRHNLPEAIRVVTAAALVLVLAHLTVLFSVLLVCLFFPSDAADEP